MSWTDQEAIIAVVVHLEDRIDRRQLTLAAFQGEAAIRVRVAFVENIVRIRAFIETRLLRLTCHRPPNEVAEKTGLQGNICLKINKKNSLLKLYCGVSM